jgi:multiple sugar transport system substrate-binding protein
VVETKLVGGQHLDMMCSEEDHLVRWHSAKWVRDVEDLPGVAQMKAGMYPGNVRDLSLPDGKLGGLPYYSGFNSFVVNANHLDQAKLQPPATWAEFLDDCRKLKRDKIAEFPYNSAWQRTWASLSWSIFSIWYSEGAKVFDASFNPVFDDKFKAVLQMHRTLYAEGLVQPDIFTIAQEGVPSFATGTHTFMVVHEYDQKVLNDPKLSKIAGAVKNVLMPGATRSTFSWSAMYLMGAQPIDPIRAWNLMQFFGGKAKDGQYHVIKRWALQFGVGNPYKELLADPEVRAAYAQWKDLDVAAKQQEVAPSRDVSKTLGLLDTRTALVIAYCSLILPLSTWIMRGYFEGMPPTLEKAALVDGCTRFRAILKVVLPVARPGIVATAIFCFLVSWNEFIFALILTGTPKAQTIPVIIAGFLVQLRFYDYGPMFAASVLAVLPPVIITLGFQRYLVSGMLSGSLKG